VTKLSSTPENTLTALKGVPDKGHGPYRTLALLVGSCIEERRRSISRRSSGVARNGARSLPIKYRGCQSDTDDVFRSVDILSLSPQPTIMTDKIWYLLVDHERKPIGRSAKAFVSADTDIEDLTEKIKTEKQHHLAHVNADELEVWKCNDPELSADRPLDKLRDIVGRIKFSKNGDYAVELAAARKVMSLGLRQHELLLIRVPGLGHSGDDTCGEFSIHILLSSGYLMNAFCLVIRKTKTKMFLTRVLSKNLKIFSSWWTSGEYFTIPIID
jgi:hypothetical protein